MAAAARRSPTFTRAISAAPSTWSPKRRRSAPIYNAGPALPTSIREVVERTAKALGMPFEQLCEVTGDRLGQDSRYWLDSSAIKRDIGWEPQIGWDEGLAEMVDWGTQIFRRAQDLADRLHLAGVSEP